MKAANAMRLQDDGARRKPWNRPHGPKSAPLPRGSASSACEVVHISYQDPHEPKGGELVAVLNLCQGLGDAGQRVTLLTPCSAGQSPDCYSLNEGRLQVVRLRASESPGPTFYGIDEGAARNRLAFAHAAAKHVRRHFRSSNAVIHAHGFSELLSAAGALRGYGYAVVAECHMLIADRAQRLGAMAEVVERLRAVESEALLANDRIIVHSRDMAQAVCRICPEFRGTIHVWPCAIGKDNFQPILVDESRMPTVIGVGRVSPEKGWESYLAAAHIIAAKRSSSRRTRFLLAGKTDEAISARRRCRQKLEDLAEHVGCIRLLISPEGVWGNDRIRLIDRSSIAVVPSLYEPFGLTMAEAMARGKPVVSFLTSGAREILEATQPGPTAFGLVADNTPESLAACIEYLLDHPEQAYAMGRNAKAKASRSFRPEQIAQHTLDLYKACHVRQGGKRCHH